MKTLAEVVNERGTAVAAAELDVSPQRLNNWVERGVPAEWCAKVELVLGVSRKIQRPDDWMDIWPELAERQDA